MSLGLAIIGYGGMGGWHCTNITEKVERVAVRGIYDIRAEAADKAREDGFAVYSSMEELLADPSVGLVTIATPNNFHRDYAIRCMRAGKAVISEKPVTMNASELRQILDAAQETGMLFSVHQNRRWDRDFVTMKQILAQGSIGEPYFIESRVQGSRRAMHGWRGYKLNGGGMLLDWGVHLLDQMLQLVDARVVSVHAHAFSIFTPEVDDNIRLFLRFENRVSALIEVATNCFINLPRWHVAGTGGTAVIEDWSCAGRIVQLREEGAMEWADDIVYTEAGPTRTMAPRPAHTTVELPLPAVESDWADYYKNIADVLENGAELIVQPQQCLRVMDVIDAAFLSIERGQSVPCKI